MNAPVTDVQDVQSRSATPSSRSATPLSPIAESSAEITMEIPPPRASDTNLNVDDSSSSANDTVSQRQSGVKPAESGGVSSLDGQSPSDGNDKGTGSDDKAMDNSSSGEQKTVLMLGRVPSPSSKSGKYIHTGFNHSGQCALTNNLLTGVPENAMLFDNGATVNCARTHMGRLLGSFESNVGTGGISVGDESSTLESEGSFLHALNIIDADGNSVSILCRMEDTPKAICNIYSEPEEVYKRGGKFTFTDQGRIWTLANGKTMRLHMTANHLAWAKFSPITDSAQVRELLSQSKNMLIVGIHRAIAAANSETVEEIDDLPAACGRVLTENTAEIDAITSSLNMLPFIDPTFQSIDPKCPLIAPELKLAMIHSSMSPTVITYESDTSRDPPEDHWLTQQQRDLVREGEWNQLAGDAVLVAAGKGKDLFVQINKSIKIPKSKTSWIAKEFINRIEAELACAETSTQTGIDKLAKLAAKGLMSLRRVCTSYEKPWDESSSCNVEERLALLMKLLNKKTNGKAKQLVDVAFNELKSEYSDAQWRDMAKQRGRGLGRQIGSQSSSRCDQLCAQDRSMQ